MIKLDDVKSGDKVRFEGNVGIVMEVDPDESVLWVDFNPHDPDIDGLIDLDPDEPDLELVNEGSDS